MSNPIFETKRLLKRYTIELQKTGVHIIKTTPLESSEFEIAYEQIETKKSVETKVSFGLLVFIFLLTFMAILFFLNGSEISAAFFLTSFILVIIALTTKLKVITIRSYDGGNIELYFTNRNKQEVLAFADSIIDSANSFILNKFSKIDKDLPIDNQLANLDFLRNKELISDEIFEQLKNQLLGRDNKKSIGYR